MLCNSNGLETSKGMMLEILSLIIIIIFIMIEHCTGVIVKYFKKCFYALSNMRLSIKRGCEHP